MVSTIQNNQYYSLNLGTIEIRKDYSRQSLYRVNSYDIFRDQFKNVFLFSNLKKNK